MNENSKYVQLPVPSNTDPDWRRKAAAAREAREMAAKARRGKSIGFRKAVGYTPR